MLTIAQALDLAIDCLDRIEVKGRSNVYNLYKAQDAITAVKVALESNQKEEKEDPETKEGE